MSRRFCETWGFSHSPSTAPATYHFISPLLRIDTTALQPLLEEIHRRFHSPRSASREDADLRQTPPLRNPPRNSRPRQPRHPQSPQTRLPKPPAKAAKPRDILRTSHTSISKIGTPFLCPRPHRRNDVPRILQRRRRPRESRTSRARYALFPLPRTAALIAPPDSANRRLNLHPDKPSRTPDHKVVAPRISPRFAHRQAMLASPRHKHRLHPLPASLRVFDNPWFENFRLDIPRFDNPRFPFLHPPRPRKQKAASVKKLANAALCFDSTRKKSQRQENRKKKWKRFPKRELRYSPGGAADNSPGRKSWVSPKK